MTEENLYQAKQEIVHIILAGMNRKEQSAELAKVFTSSLKKELTHEEYKKLIDYMCELL